MLCYYTDIPFRNKVIRFRRPDAGQSPLSQGMMALVRQIHEGKKSIIAVPKHGSDTFGNFRTPEELAFWQDFLNEHGLMYDDLYQWTRANAEV